MSLFSLSVCGFPHPRAGYFLLVQKVPKNTSAPFGLDPRFFVQSVTSMGDAWLPLKYLFAAGLLVIGAVHYALRLSPLGLIGVSCCAKK